MNDISTGLAPYEPRNISEAQGLAIAFAKSGFLTGITTPEQALLIMAVGHELGIPATAALRSIHIVKGKPCLSADLMVALVKRSSVCEYFRIVESTDERATYVTKRRGDPEVRQTFSQADARRASLGGGNWTAYPRVMLRHRAAAELARLVYPDVCLGIYAEEELADLPPIEITPIEAEPVNEVTTTPVPAAGGNGIDWSERLTACTDLEGLAAVRAEIREHYGKTVPRYVADAWRARETELKQGAAS